MRVKTVSFVEDPDRVVREPFDCIWIALSPPKAPTPLKSPALQWLDWKLQGQISRILIEDAHEVGTKVTFLPTMKKIASPFLALDLRKESDWSEFLATCDGLKLKTLLFFCEGETRRRELETRFAKLGEREYPEVVLLGLEAEGTW